MTQRTGFAVLLPVIIVLTGCTSPPGADAKPRIVLPGTARTIDFPGSLTTVLLEGHATQGDVAVVEFLVAPRSFGAPPHVHHSEDEYFYVLEGEIRFLNEPAERLTEPDDPVIAANVRRLNELLFAPLDYALVARTSA